MPIQEIDENPYVEPIGKIRLGMRKTAQSGAQYPTTVPYFVLNDAPNVEKVYGPEPTEIDVIFVTDDIDAIAPSWLKWYGAGVKGSDGKVIGGKIMCQGNGPDSNGNPGIAQHYRERDPLTKVVPERECLGRNCKDWTDHKGNPQCKPTMQLNAILPRVTMSGIYRIDTTSWQSIRSFRSQLMWRKKLNGGRLAWHPFKIIRKERVNNFVDPKTNKERTSKQYIMLLEENEEFYQAHGKEVQAKIAAIADAAKTFAVPLNFTQDHVEGSMEDHWPVLEAGETEALPAPKEEPKGPTPLEVSQGLLKDNDIIQAFEALEKHMGKKFPDKNRLVAIRKKEGGPEQKKQVLAAIYAKLPTEPDPEPVKQEPVQEQPPQEEPPPPTEMDAPPEDDDGII